MSLRAHAEKMIGVIATEYRRLGREAGGYATVARAIEDGTLRRRGVRPSPPADENSP